MRRKGIIVCGLTAIVAVVVLIKVAFFVNPLFLGESKGELIAKGDKIIASVRKYERLHGCLPTRLMDACSQSEISTSFGDFEYFQKTVDGEETFCLRLGDFDTTKFYLEWNSESSQWYYDQLPN